MPDHAMSSSLTKAVRSELYGPVCDSECISGNLRRAVLLLARDTPPTRWKKKGKGKGGGEVDIRLEELLIERENKDCAEAGNSPR